MFPLPKTSIFQTVLGNSRQFEIFLEILDHSEHGAWRTGKLMKPGDPLMPKTHLINGAGSILFPGKLTLYTYTTTSLYAPIPTIVTTIRNITGHT